MTMASPRSILAAFAAALALGGVALGSVAFGGLPASAAADDPPEIIRVLAFDGEVGPWGSSYVPAATCPFTHPWLVNQNLTGSRPGVYYKGVELIDAENSIYMLMWKSRHVADAFTGYVTGVAAQGGTVNNANPFITASYEVWFSCTRVPEKYGFTADDGVLRTAG